MADFLRAGAPERRLAGVGAVFVSILLVYGAFYFVIGPHAVGVTIAFTGAVLVYLMRRWKPIVPTYDMQLNNIEASVNLSPLRNSPVLPFTDTALDGIELLSIVSHVLGTNARWVVECGSGVSTLMIGNLLHSRGAGHLFSLEEDEAWFELMRRQVSAQGLAERVTILHAPIAPWDGASAWYDRAIAQSILAEVPHIDLLLVDGPQGKRGQSRYGALPVFAPALDAASLIMLHDLVREAERAVLDRWRIEFGATCDVVIGSARRLGHLRLQSRPGDSGEANRTA